MLLIGRSKEYSFAFFKKTDTDINHKNGDSLKMSSAKMRQSIMIVDDEADLLNLYRLNLKSLDADIHTFTNPKEALALLREDHSFQPDLLISDFMMPGMKGIDLIKEFAQLRPQVPTILLSAYLDKEKAINAANIGVFSILEKPIGKEDLISGVKTLLLENRSSKIHEEIDSVMTQMSELFSVFRIICLDELELNSVHEKDLKNDPNSVAEEAMSLEQELGELDKKLKSLWEEEKALKKSG